MPKDSKVTSKKTEDKKATVKSAATTVKKTTAKVTKAATKKPAVKKTTVKKAAAKKPVVKKTAAKKATVKKAAAKKPAPKKAAPKAAAESPRQKTSSSAPSSATTEKENIENVFPGLDKGRDWKNFVLRVTYIAAFGVLGWLAFGAAITMTVIQVVITVLLGAPNETLQSWVSTIGRYLAEVFDYISWNTDEKPFPLGRPVPLDE